MKSQLDNYKQNNYNLKTQVKQLTTQSQILKENQRSFKSKIHQLEFTHQNDKIRILQQERQILELQEKLKRQELEVNKIKHANKEETDKLKTNFDKVVDVKLKYENIIKTLAEKPEIKPIIASILEKM